MILLWHNGTGFAEYDGVRVALRHPPPIVDGIKQLVFIPGVASGVSTETEPLREMTFDEFDRTWKMVVQMASDAHDALDGQSTLVVVVNRTKSAPAPSPAPT